MGDGGYGIATDAVGNSYITGEFQSPTITFGTTTLNCSGNKDIFVTKFDPSGNVLWAKGIGGSSNEVSWSIFESGGDVYLTGYYESTSLTIGTTTLSNAGLADIFLTKFDANGNVIWVKNAGATGNDQGWAVATDPAGNVLLIGSFASSVLTLGSYTLTNTGNKDIYVAKFDSNGNVLWAKSAIGTGDDFGGSIISDINGNVYIGGSFVSPTLSFGTTTLTSAGSDDVYLAKYDSNGNELWAKSSGGVNGDYGGNIVLDASGNICLAGYFSSLSFTCGTTTLNRLGPSIDGFVAKYNPNGNLAWAKNVAGTSGVFCYGILTDTGNNVYVSGDFTGTLNTFSPTVLSSSGNKDIFVGKFDGNGNPIWAINAGGNSIESGYNLSRDAANNVYLTGMYVSSPASFGTNTLSCSGGSDFFIAMLGSTTSGINENYFSDLTAVFPNPFFDQTTLVFESAMNNATLTLYNSIGQKVKEFQKLNGEEMVLQRDNLPSGMYFIRIVEGAKLIATKKLIVTD